MTRVIVIIKYGDIEALVPVDYVDLDKQHLKVSLEVLKCTEMDCKHYLEKSIGTTCPDGKHLKE